MRIRCLLTAAAAVLSVTWASASAASAAVVPGRVIVRYHSGVTHGERVRALESTGTATDAPLPDGARELEIEDGDSVGQTVAELNADPSVAYAVPDYVAHAAD